jgi:hypothetical protein
VVLFLKGEITMPKEYTRQRQGRDFSLSEYLKNAAAVKSKKIEDDKKTAEQNKSLTDRLKQYKEESKRNAVPIDGHEPPEHGGISRDI